MSRKDSTGESFRADDIEYIQMVTRMIRAAGKRGAGADAYMLKLVREMHDAVDQAELIAVDGLREQGFSWDEIATDQDMTRQATLRRYNRPEAHTEIRAKAKAQRAAR